MDEEFKSKVGLLIDTVRALTKSIGELGVRIEGLSAMMKTSEERESKREELKRLGIKE